MGSNFNEVLKRRAEERGSGNQNTATSYAPAVDASGYGKTGYNSFDSVLEKRYTERNQKTQNQSNYVKKFLDNADNFFRAVDSDINGSKGFNAADYFEERQKQANALKSSASIVSQYLDEYGDSFTPESYDYLRSYLSNFDTNVDDVMGYYQPAVSAKQGMQAYQDEYAAFMEEQQKKQGIMDTVFSNPDLANNPAYSIYNALKAIPSDASYQNIGDQWTDDQKYNLGTLYMEDPEKARKYAEEVNLGRDPAETYRRNEAMKTDDLNALQLEVDELTRELNAAKLEADRAESQNRETYYSTGDNTNQEAMDQKIRELEAAVTEKTKYLNEAKRIQQIESYSALTGNADFAEKSAYVSTKKHLNELYEYSDLFKRSDPLYEYVNNVGKEGYASGGNGPFADSLYEKMNEDEVAIFNYLYATEGKNSAQAYLDTIQETLNQRKVEELFQGIQGNTAKEILFGIPAGIGQFGSGVQSLLNFSDDYIPNSPYAFAGQMAREDLDDNGFRLPIALGGASLGQMAYDTLNTTANMVPSIAIGALATAATGNPAIGKLVGGATMGAGAAGGAYQEALNSGYTKEQARTYSALVGASEAGLEYLLGGISAVGGKIPEKVLDKIIDGVDSALGRAAITLGGKMASEGFEEGLQEVLTPWIKNLTLLTNEDVNWNEVAYSTLLGALSAGPMEIGNAVRSARGSGSSGISSTTFQMAKVSGTDQAKQISTDTDVKIHDFAGIDDKGNATVNLEGGGTAAMDDVMFASETEARQYSVVRSLPGIDTENANEALHYMKENGGAESTQEALGIREAYGLGYYGFNKRDVFARGRDSSKISAKLANQMYKIGQQQRKADQSVTAQALPQNKTAAPSEGYKKVSFVGKVTFDANEKVKARQEANVKMMDFIADQFSGNTVRVYQSYERNGRRYYKDNDGKERRAPNGMYQDNEIWVDLNAGNNGEGLMLNTFGHEMYHHIEKWNKKGAHDLAEFLINELGGKSVDRAVMKQIQKARAAGYGESHFTKKGFTEQQARNMVYDRAMSDFVADSLETMFTHGDPAAALAKLRSENQTLYDEIKNFVNEWVTKLREFISGKTISDEGRAVAQLEKFEEIQKLFMEAMDTAGQNFAAAEVGAEKNTTPESDVKYSERTEQRITMSMTDSERTEILKNKVITAEVYEGQADHSIADKKGALTSYRENLIKAALVKIGEEFKVFTDYNIADVKTDFRLSRGNIKESVSKEIDPITLAKLMPVFRTAVENAIGIERHANRYFFDNDTVSFENLLGGYVEGGQFVPIRFGLKHSKSGGATLYLIVDQNAVDIKKIKAEVTKVPSAQDAHTDTSRPAFKISLPSVIPFVNSKDLLRYVPDDMLTDGQKKLKWEAIAETIVYTNNKNDKKYAEFIGNGNLVAASMMVEQAAKTAGYTNLFYHGAKKGGGFTRFREWSYFTENKGYAERYAQRDNPDSLYEVFAKMEKPFDTRDADARAIFDDIRSEYGLSEIQDSGLPDWTDGYDITDYIDENQLNYDSVVLDEGGDLVDGKPISRGLSYIIRKSEQVKSADVITYDDNGNIIPISQRFSTENKDIRYSLRGEKKDNSVRGILSRIDVASKKNLAEKEHLGKYQDRSAKLTEAETQMAETKAKIEATTDKKELAKLQNEQRKLKSTIDGLKNRMKGFEKTDLAKKLISDQKLLEYREEQKAEFDALTEEYRQTRKELTGYDSVIQVMEDEFVKLAKDYEAKKIDLKTMEAEFIRLAKEYDKQAEVAGQTKQLKEDNATWQREFRRLMREYDAADRKISKLEATILYQRQRASEKVQSRRNTELRHKIERRFGNLDRMLRKGSKTSYVPESLREPVAAILEAIDMRKSNRETKVAQELKNLRLAYHDIRKNSDPNISSIYDEGLAGHLETLTDIVGDTSLGDMNKNQLEAVYDILTAVLETVRNANEAFVADKRAEISEMSNAAMRQVRTAGGEKYVGKAERGIVKTLKAFMWNDMRPVDVFDAIGSEELKNLFKNIRKGEDTWARDIQESRDFFRQQWQKYKGDNWDMDQKFTFRSASGKEFQLSTEQIMSIYALFRRDKAQAMAHLRQGGFVFDNNAADAKGRTTTDATAYNLTDDTILKIIGTLSNDQMRFVESMQGYLSDVMGAKGNEVSMKLYGIKLFREKNYFPLRSAQQYMESAKSNQRGDVKIKNSGFTKPVKPNANTAIVLTPFLNVWGSHVDEMSNYHAFVLPMEDMYRVYNYRTDVSSEESATRSVQSAIQNAYGEGAVKAIDQLLKDINGGVRSDSTASVISKMISRYKKGATMASLSVAAQQPSAILRAASMIDPKHFIGRKMDSKYTDRTWNEIKRHAPIAIIKEIGGFDTNTGLAMADYLTKMEYEGFNAQFKAFFEDGKFRDDVLGRLPAWADEVSWSVIWNAVKREQRDLHPDMNITSDAFLNLVGERFSDVIIHTQVYDSVLAKNAMMRSKDTGMKMITSFMAEPTVTANMLSGAITRAIRNGDKAGAIRTVSSIVASTLVNAAAVSVIYALRDDDEEERFGEKWITNFRENLLESANPMGYIPLLRDVNNILRGYDIERADMSIVSDIAEAVKSLGNEDMSDWEKVDKFTGAIMNVFGLPYKNISRDVKGIWNTLRTRFGADNVSTSTGRSIAWSGQNLNDGDELLLAIQRGDTAHFERVASRFENRQKADSALQSAIRKQYIADDITEADAQQLLTDYFERDDESEVYWILEEWNYAKENGTSEGYSKMGDLMEAVESGEGLDAEIQRYLDNGTEMSTIRSQISKVYRKKYLEADEAGREEIRRVFSDAYRATGSSKDDIQDKFDSWDFESEYGMTYDDMIAEYKAGEISRSQLQDAMKYKGMKNFEISEKFDSLDSDIAFQRNYGMSLSEMYSQYDDGEISRNTMINALVYDGMTKKDATEKINQRDISNRYGIEYAKLDDAYKHGDITRNTLYNAMIQNGATKDEADEAIIGYDWLKKHVNSHPDLTISDAKKFTISIGDNAKEYTLGDFGVSIEAYKMYKERIGDCKGVDLNGDGKTDDGTLRDAILTMIDSLPISDEAKDGLALQRYSKKSIKKNAPWH